MSPAPTDPGEMLAAALDEGDLARAADLVSRHLWVLAQSRWDLLSETLQRLPEATVAADPTLAIFKEFGGSVFTPSGAMNRGVEPVLQFPRVDGVSLGEPVLDAILAQEMVAHRVNGDLAEAKSVAGRLRTRVDRPDAQGRRPAHSAVAFHLLQIGITEALAGDLEQALRDFVQGTVMQHPEGAPLVDWDLGLKNALVNAALGRHSEAEAVLARAAEDPGPEVGEPFATHIAGTLLAIRALLAVDRLDPDATELVHAAVATNAEAEMWPFALLASTRWSLATGDLVGVLDAVDRAEVLHRIPRGSLAEEVIAAARGDALMLLGEFGAAAEALDRFGPGARGLAAVAVARVRLALLADGPEAAIAAARRLIVQPGLGPAARAETMLQMAWAQAAMLDRPDPVTTGPVGAIVGRQELWRLLQLVPEQVAVRIPGVERASEFERRLALREPATGTRLTPIEREILEALAGPDSLPAIARARFVTLNTVKTQVASVYRRLGVHGRREAVAEGMRRGLLGRPAG